MSIAYLLSGSNLGDRAANLQSAMSLIREHAGNITVCSPVYESPSWGFEHPVPFLNQAIEIETSLSAESLLSTLHQIERKCGRKRSGDGYAARTLDIDILFYDDIIIDTADLSIPHPRLQLRRFALLPMSVIAPGLQHPVLGKSISELLHECPDDSIVTEFKVGDPDQKKEVRDAI